MHISISVQLKKPLGYSPLGKLADQAIYFTFRNFFLFKCRQIISGSTGTIFAIIAPNDRYLFQYDRSGPLFLIPQGKFMWQPVSRKICIFSVQSTLSRCHSETDCNIAIPILKD